MRTTPTEAQRAKAHRQMIVEDGATARGEQPPPEHLEALDAADAAEQIEVVRAAHAEGRAPPDDLGNGGRGN